MGNGDWHRLSTLRVVCTCLVPTIAPDRALKKWHPRDFTVARSYTEFMVYISLGLVLMHIGLILLD